MPSTNSSSFRRDPLRTTSILYVSVPNLVFVLGWLWWPYAALVAAASCYALYRASTRPVALPAEPASHGLRHFGWIGLIVLIWMANSGIGGFGHQNADWILRNIVLRTLLDSSWPSIVSVAEAPRMMVSYLAYYMPSAVLGRLFALLFDSGWLVANVTLWLWSLLGVVMAVLWLMRLSQNRSVVPALVLVAFGGMNVIGWLIYNGGLPELNHSVDFWSHDKLLLLYPGFTAQLYWVPHQAIAAWILVSLVLDDGLRTGTSANLVFYGGNSILWSPFVTLGLAPYAAWALLKTRWRSVASVQNLAVLPLALVALIFLTSLDSGKIISGPHWQIGRARSMSLVEYLQIYLLFLALNFGVYAVLIRASISRSPDWSSRWRPLFWITVITLSVIPLYRMSLVNVFCLRVSTPSLFTLLVLISATLRVEASAEQRKRVPALILAATLVLGSWGATAEVSRSVMAIAARPELLLPPPPLRRVASFSEHAKHVKLFGTHYSAGLDSLFARHLAPATAKP